MKRNINLKCKEMFYNQLNGIIFSCNVLSREILLSSAFKRDKLNSNSCTIILTLYQAGIKSSQLLGVQKPCMRSGKSYLNIIRNIR